MRLLEVLQERTMAKNRVRDEELALEGLRARAASLGRQRDGLVERRDEGRSEHEAELNRLRELGCNIGRAELLLQRELGRGESLSAEKRALLEALHGLDREASALRTRMALLVELEQAREGLRRRRPRGPRPRLPGSGRLVEFVDCPLELGPALEAVLGERVQAIVLDSADSAVAALAPPCATARARSSSPTATGPCPTGSPSTAASRASANHQGLPLLGFLGVRAPARAALERLLRGVVVVPDHDAARRLAESGEDLVFVTPAGELVDGPWLAAGRADPAAGPIQRRSALEAMRRELQGLEAELEELARGQVQLEARIERRLGQRRRLEAVIDALSRQQGLVEHSLETRARQRAREPTGRSPGWTASSPTSTATASAAWPGSTGRCSTGCCSSVASEGLEQQKRDLRSGSSSSTARPSRPPRPWPCCSAARPASSPSCAASGWPCSSTSSTTSARAQRLEGQVERAGREVGALVVSLASWRSQAVDRACQVRFLSGRLDELELEFEELEGRGRRAPARAERREADLEGLPRAPRRHRARGARGPAQAGGSTRSVGSSTGSARQTARRGHRLRDLAARRDPGPPVQPSSASRSWPAPPAPPDRYRGRAGAAAAVGGAGLLDRGRPRGGPHPPVRLGRMGSVNLEAEAELAGLEEGRAARARLRDLRGGPARAARDDPRHQPALAQAIPATFDAARTHFQEIFRMLFQGGEGRHGAARDRRCSRRASRSTPGRPARAPLDQAAQRRRALLTALAILFAVFKVKPSPFCILDEVDAALDEANVERFLRVLAGFVRHTQFLIVTHHKRTMADCEVLYGITMQRRGISSRMAVSLAGVESGEVDGSSPSGGPRDIAAERRVAGEEAVGFGGAG
ncbi:MAG: hypothetical protein R3F30_03225 [Planctomycetota bacterium]